MKYIITEKQLERLGVLRRIEQLKKLIYNLPAYSYPCDYESLEDYTLALRMELEDHLGFDFVNNIEDEDTVWDILMEVFKGEMIENYMYHCVNPEENKS